MREIEERTRAFFHSFYRNEREVFRFICQKELLQILILYGSSGQQKFALFLSLYVIFLEKVATFFPFLPFLFCSASTFDVVFGFTITDHESRYLSSKLFPKKKNCTLYILSFYIFYDVFMNLMSGKIWWNLQLTRNSGLGKSSFLRYSSFMKLSSMEK